MGATKLWDLIRDIEKRHHAKKATRLGLETILERVNIDIASYFGSRLTESHERTVLIDLSGSLSELQSRQRDAIAAKTLVEHDHAVALELTRLDWIRGKLDRCRARYGRDAKLVVFADHPDTRTIEKLEQLRSRYKPVAQQLTRELAGEIAATGRLSTHQPDPVRPEEFEQPVLDNDRSNEDDVEEPAPDNAGEHDAELEVEVVSRTSRTRGNRARAAARTARRAAKIMREAEKGGAAINYHGLAKIVWDRRQKCMPPIQLPTEADTHHPDARISSLASFLLDQATFVQATREADQAIASYVRTHGAETSTAYVVLSQPSRPTATACDSSDTTTGTRPSPAWIIDGVDGDLVVDFPFDIVRDAFVVSDITRAKVPLTRVVDLDRLYECIDFPFKSTASRIFAHSVIGSDLSPGVMSLGWVKMIQNKKLCSLIVDSQSWVDKAKAATSNESEMDALNRRYDQSLNDCFKEDFERAWDLRKLVEWFDIRTGGPDPSGPLSKKGITLEMVVETTQNGLARLNKRRTPGEATSHDHVSVTTKPAEIQPVDAAVVERFNAPNTTRHPRALFPLNDSRLPFTDRGVHDTALVDGTKPRRTTGQYGPSGRREPAPLVRSRIVNNGGSRNLADQLVARTNARFQEKHGPNYQAAAQAENEAALETRQSRMEQAAKRKAVQSRPRPIQRVAADTKTKSSAPPRSRGYRAGGVFAARVRTRRFCVRAFKKLAFRESSDQSERAGEIRSAFHFVLDVLTQYGTGQMQQVFDVCQSALVDLSYHCSTFVTALETTGKGMVDFIVATGSLLHSLDNAVASEPADGQLVAKTMKGFREHAGKQTADLVRDELELINITESECRAFAKSLSDWINPVVLLHCLREKRRPRRSKFRLNVNALLQANFASSSSNFKLASAQHASTVLRDLARQAVSDAWGLLRRPGDFGPDSTPIASRRTRLFDARLLQVSDEAGVRESLRLIEGYAVKSGHAREMVQCGEEYLIRSTVEIGTGPDDDDSDELLRKHIRQHFESLRPKILVSVPDAVLAADPDLAAHLDKVSNVIVEIFKGLRYSIRSRIWAERVATRRQEKWDRMRAAASVVKKRKGPKRISSDDLAGIATIGQFFAPANLKNASQSDPNKLDDEPDSNDANENGNDDDDEYKSDTDRYACAARRVAMQFCQVLKLQQMSRTVRSLSLTIPLLARLVRSQSRLARNALNLFLPDLVSAEVDDLHEAVAHLNSPSFLPSGRRKLATANNDDPSLPDYVHDKATRFDRTRRDRLTRLAHRYPDQWLIRGVHDHPLVQIDKPLSRQSMHVDNPDKIPAVRVCPARHQKLVKAVEVVSKVLEGFVKEVPSNSTQRDKPKERSFFDLQGYLEEFAGEIARQIFAVPFARVLPTGRFTVTLLGDLRVDVIDPLKLTTKGRATLAKMNLSPQLGWKTLVPTILSHTSSGLTERLPWLTCTHVVEILTTPQQPPPNNNVARRVARMNVARSNMPRNLAPLFELVNHASSDQTTGSTGADTIRTPSRLDWTCKSGVVGRKDGPPRLDQGVAYDDFRFLSEDAPESALRTRNQLEFANSADVDISIDLGERVLVSAVISRRGETSDVLLSEKVETSSKVKRDLKRVGLALRRKGPARALGKAFEANGRPVGSPLSFFSNEGHESGISTTPMATGPLVNPMRGHAPPTTALPPLIARKLKARQGFDDSILTKQANVSQRRARQQSWSRLLGPLLRDAKSVGVKIGLRGKGGTLAAGPATESLDALLTVVKSFGIPHEIVTLDEGWTSTYCYQCGATLAYPSREDISGKTSPILRLLYCDHCKQIFHRDTVGAVNMVLVSHSVDLLVPANILSLDNVKLRDGDIDRPDRKTTRKKALEKDDAIRSTRLQKG